jgi:hypothetical protein
MQGIRKLFDLSLKDTLSFLSQKVQISAPPFYLFRGCSEVRGNLSVKGLQLTVFIMKVSPNVV